MQVLSRARSQLHHVDEATGRAGVLESKLAKSNLRGSDLSPQGATGPHPANLSLDEKLKQLQILRDDKLISEQEYQEKRKALIEMTATGMEALTVNPTFRTR